jgi:hypothetical protein
MRLQETASLLQSQPDRPGPTPARIAARPNFILERAFIDREQRVSPLAIAAAAFRHEAGPQGPCPNLGMGVLTRLRASWTLHGARPCHERA